MSQSFATAEGRIGMLKATHDRRTGRMIGLGLQIATLPQVPIWVVAGIASGTETMIVLAIILSLACAAAGMLIMGEALVARRQKMFALSGRDAHDPDGNVDRLTALIEAVKDERLTLKQRQSRFDEAMKALQRFLPGEPLSLLIRHGYYPSRPDDDGSTVNNDDDAPIEHWDRAVAATGELTAIMARKSDEPVTVKEVRKALSRLIPPLRASCREIGIDTHKVDYMPQGIGRQRASRIPEKRSVDPVIAEATVRAGSTDADARTKDGGGAAVRPDALTPIEDRLNASATMTTAAIRVLMLSFENADESIFMNGDHDDARMLMERRLPDMIRSYVVAHDGTTGAERDDVRADFARMLIVVRDTLERIMDGYVRSARQTMENERRYLESRHNDVNVLGDDTLR